MTVLDCLRLLGADVGAYTDILDREISTVTDNSRCIVPDCVFVCIAGRHFDGHTVAEKALEQGALLIVAQRELATANTVQVPDTHSALSCLVQGLHGFPSKALELIGITGTNGKTTISFMLKGILDTLGIPAGLIGTVRNELGELIIPSKFTTPAPTELAELFSAMRDAGVKSVAMEVSSQALAQGRVAGLEFGVGVFTNLTQDHLDYHGDMQSYFEAKKKLADQSRLLLINIDDEWGRRLYDQYRQKSLIFSEKDSTADYYATAAAPTDSGMRYTLKHGGYSYEVTVPVFGGFSVMNSMQAIGALAECGVDIVSADSGMRYTLKHGGYSYEVTVPVFGGFSVMNSMQAIGALAECGVDIVSVVSAIQHTLKHGGYSYEVTVPVFGGFSVMNSMQAIGALAECGVDIVSVVSAIQHFGGVPGRTELLYADGSFKVIRDYAHAPTAIESVLHDFKLYVFGGVPGRTELLYADGSFKVIRDYAHAPTAIESVLHDFKLYVKHRRMVTLFGCAGNRDRTKRVDMARAAASHSDLVILTSDNPRDENELQIIEDALPGLVSSGVEYVVIPDRYTAILWAIEHRQPGDLLLLLGKGHEDYQVLFDGTIYFDEAVIVDELMRHAQTGRLLGDV